MPVHVAEMSSEVTVIEGELPLTPAQIEKLVKLVMSRIAEKQHDSASNHEATKLRRQSSTPFEVGS
jgi:hypothetical protein